MIHHEKYRVQHIVESITVGEGNVVSCVTGPGAAEDQVGVY